MWAMLSPGGEGISSQTAPQNGDAHPPRPVGLDFRGSIQYHAAHADALWTVMGEGGGDGKNDPAQLQAGETGGDLLPRSKGAGRSVDLCVWPGGTERRWRDRWQRRYSGVKVTAFVTDVSHLKAIHEVRAEYFRRDYPASTLVEVKSLVSPELMIEIEAVAVTSA
jgi:hypothetical protein